jgi:serine/threonine protein kinase
VGLKPKLVQKAKQKMALRLTLADGVPSGEAGGGGAANAPPQPRVGNAPGLMTVTSQQGLAQLRQSATQQDTSVPEIASDEVQLLEVLGDGSYGTVYKGMCRQKWVAIKVLREKIAQGLSNPDTRESFRHEIRVLSKIYHPNVCLFMGACTEPGRLMIVSELMKQDVDTLLADASVDLSMLQRMRIAKGAALGVLWLHSSNPQIIHRDLKPSK